MISIWLNQLVIQAKFFTRRKEITTSAEADIYLVLHVTTLKFPDRGSMNPYIESIFNSEHFQNMQDMDPGCQIFIEVLSWRLFRDLIASPK